ncbi:MAG: hypothetical protein CMO04_08160 [Thalassospira sp.]|nr:hypothetical protein [Thalassospira sp.]HAY48386.1 hypothetical protein [Thalassospira sp.]
MQLLQVCIARAELSVALRFNPVYIAPTFGSVDDKGVLMYGSFMFRRPFWKPSWGVTKFLK